MGAHGQGRQAGRSAATARRASTAIDLPRGDPGAAQGLTKGTPRVAAGLAAGSSRGRGKEPQASQGHRGASSPAMRLLSLRGASPFRNALGVSIRI
eukprot:15425613-Alexandrium_andersonii.AAC.1